MVISAHLRTVPSALSQDLSPNKKKIMMGKLCNYHHLWRLDHGEASEVWFVKRFQILFAIDNE